MKKNIFLSILMLIACGTLNCAGENIEWKKRCNISSRLTKEQQIVIIVDAVDVLALVYEAEAAESNPEKVAKATKALREYQRYLSYQDPFFPDAGYEANARLRALAEQLPAFGKTYNE